VARFDSFERSGAAIAALFLAAAPIAQAQTAAPAQPPAVSTAPGAANWSRIRDGAQFGIYLDLNSVRPTADEAAHARLVDAAGLLDFKVAQVLGDHQVSSVKYVLSFDCGQKQLKLLATTYYERNMAEGRLVNTDQANDAWHAPDPRTPEAPLLTAACSTR
jgi:hypothetical protein